MKYIVSSALGLLFAVVAVSCGKSDSTTSYTYSSTSTKGDYAEWTVSGDTMTIVWTATTDTGAVKKTFNITAGCGSVNATYGFKACTITSASCTGGTEACGSEDNPSGTFNALVVPGVALAVHTGGTGGDKQLHIGLLKDADGCGSVAGDYSFARLGNGQLDLFGMFRSDAQLNSVIHADFKMVFDTSVATTPTVGYSTGDTGGNATLVGSGCDGGVRTRTLNSKTIRAMMTPSGLMVFDMPAGEGGMVAFKTDKAASLADFAGKSFGGIVFPDNDDPQLMGVTGGAVSGTTVPLTIQIQSDESPGTGIVIRPVTDATSTAENPSYPSFSDVPSGYSTETNGLAATYANPSAIPGLFKIDGTFSDEGRVVMVAMKYNDKIIGFGVVYNGRGDPVNRLENTGSFLLFEK